MTKSRKLVPEFANEADERAFWESHDSSEYLDWSQAREARFPHLGPSTKAISLRLPEALLTRIRAQAKRMDVPYQSLIKIWLSEKAADLERHPE